MRMLLVKQEGLFFFAPKLNVSIAEINDNEGRLQQYHRLLDCNRIEMPDVEIDGHYYNAICDEEGLMNGNPVPTLYINEDRVLFGSLLFCKENEDGATIGLDDNDIRRISKYIKRQIKPMNAFLKRERDRLIERQMA